MSERAYYYSQDEDPDFDEISPFCTDHQPSFSSDHYVLRVNEDAPLLSSDTDDREVEYPILERGDVNAHDELQETKSLWYMILLTIGIGGLQLAWSVELSNGSPYLLSLGLSKSLMALVWMAGPLSGTLVQPYVGMLSDDCRSHWGKRTPFIFFGSLATILSLLALAWTPEFVSKFLGIFGINPESQGVKNCVIVIAVLFVYVLDFAINTVQAGIRAFILDGAPSHQQEVANSMASRLLSVGNIIGYVAGFINLKNYLWFLGNSQFQILCAVACFALGFTVALSVLSIRERDPNNPPSSSQDKNNRQKAGLISFFKTVFTSIRRLPLLTKQVCEIQLFVWVSYFPQLFYSSSYVADIYVQPYLEDNPHMTPMELNVLYEKATRVGTFALLIYAITSLCTNLLLPIFIEPSYDIQPVTSASLLTHTRTSRFFHGLVIPGFTLRRAWLYSHLMFAACLLSTLFIRRIATATVLIGLIGIPWALTQWAPYAIISAEVSKRNALRRARVARLGSTSMPPESLHVQEDQAGVILGIHNMSIAAPQIVATLGSSIIFRMLQKPRGVPGDRSISVVFACSGMTILIAAWLTSRMKDEIIITDDDDESVVHEEVEIPCTDQ
ncbi:hypothetical protein K3495_g10658 [Podosphaera aphanis]|nr:hypothetical protein K3495_g10658 [Podosphaera aphanis]